MKKIQLSILILFLAFLFACSKTTADVKIENHTWSGCYITFKEIDKSSGSTLQSKILYYGESSKMIIKKGNSICWYGSGTCGGSDCRTFNADGTLTTY